MTEERKCIVCGKVLEKEDLLRFTITEDKQVIPDFKKRLAGRGVWVANSKTALQTAIAKDLFSKSCKTKTKTNNELMEIVENLLRKRGLDAISLSRKAGVLIVGLEKVTEAIKKNKVAFVLEAKNAGTDGHNKIVSLAKDLKIFQTYSVDELDKALDKTNTAHIAFRKSEMADTVQKEILRFETFLNS